MDTPCQTPSCPYAIPEDATVAVAQCAQCGKSVVFKTPTPVVEQPQA